MTEYELSLSDYGRILQKRKWVIVLTFLFVFISTYIYTKFEVPTFEAMIEIKIDKKDPEPSLNNLWFALPELKTEIQVIKSLPIIKRAVEKIEVLPTDFEERERRLTSLARGYQRGVQVSQVEETNILSIQTRSNNSKKAVMLANAIVDAFSEDGVESGRRRQAQSVLDYTESQIIQLRQKLEDGEKELLKFEQNERALIVTSEVKQTLDRLSVQRTFEFERELFKFRSEIGELEESIQSLRNKGRLTYLTDNDLSENLIFTGLKRRLLELEFERYLILIDYTEDHPSILKTNKIISEVKARMLTMIEEFKDISLSSQMRNDIELVINKLFLSIRAEVLYRIINKFYNESGSLSPDQLHYQYLKRNVDKTLDTYNKFLDRQEEAQLAFMTELTEISIVSPAAEPKKPIKPNEGVNYLVGSALGLLMGFILAFLVEGMDTAIWTVEDIERMVKFPIFGIIPFIKSDEFLSGNIESKRSLVTVFKPHSHEAESFMTLRTNLMHVMETKNKKIILFTSSDQKEGKTTVAVNVAMSMAQLGKKTLIIEANLRRPSIYKTFGIERSPGLSDVLVGQLPWQETIKSPTDLLLGEMDVDKLLAMPGVGNLSIMPSGESVLNPSVILDSNSLERVFAELKLHFDVVIVVCAPILPVADSTALSKKVDGVVLVAQVGITRKEIFKRATTHLQIVGADIIGVALNQAKPESLIGTSVDFRHYRSDGDGGSKSGVIQRILGTY